MTKPPITESGTSLSEGVKALDVTSRERPASIAIAWLEAKLMALGDAWRADIRAHGDGCAATFSNNVPDDCGCGLTDKRDREIALINDGVTDDDG